MSDFKKCTNCGSKELILLDEKTQHYKCHSCLKTFNSVKSVNNDLSSTEQLSLSKRKIFFDKLMNKVVALNSYFEKDVLAGTGFFISDGYVLTNAHVVFKSMKDDCNIADFAIQVTGSNYSKAKQFNFDIVSADRKLDIAILKANERNNAFVSFSQNIYNGEQVFAIGNSRGEGLCIVEGIVSDVSRVIGSNKVFMTSALVTSGNSGCPIFNVQGQLLGMISEGSKVAAAMNYAIPSSVLSEYIKKVESSEEISILQ